MHCSMADQPRKSKNNQRNYTKMGKETDLKVSSKTEIQNELLNLKTCSYESYKCTKNRVEGGQYCMRHILADKTAPYKQCSFTHAVNGKRCHLPAIKADKKEHVYCNRHALKTTLTKNRQSSKNPPPESAESLLIHLNHYIKNTNEHDTDKLLKINDPYTDFNPTAIYNEHCSEVLDMCSDSESDIEPSTHATVWHDASVDSSEAESDGLENDALRTAECFTEEEILRLSKNKLTRLQKLYLEEFNFIRYKFKYIRKKHLKNLKKEKETCCSIYNQVKDNQKEQRLYKKLKALTGFHKSNSAYAAVCRRNFDQRQKFKENSTKLPTNYHKCTFVDLGVKCVGRVLPMTKYCRKHILEDPSQLLFKACSKVNGAGEECRTPIEGIFEDSTCKLHMEFPAIRNYSQPKPDHEKCSSDTDDTLDLNNLTSNSVKTELLDYTIPCASKIPAELFEDAESLSSSLQFPDLVEAKEEVLQNEPVPLSDGVSFTISSFDADEDDVVQPTQKID